VWIKICLSVGFLDLGRLAMVCSMLHRVTASPQIWEPRCHRVWRYQGYLPCNDTLYRYGWSWRKMVRASCVGVLVRLALSVRLGSRITSHRPNAQSPNRTPPPDSAACGPGDLPSRAHTAPALLPSPLDRTCARSTSSARGCARTACTCSR
jgi:hypothetical protein